MTQPGDPSFGWDIGEEAAGDQSLESGQTPREVAVDAPGASRTYTYAVPARMDRLEDGEAVLVEFGRSRQALGVVLGPARGEVPPDAKPILARVRADGPLLPRLTLDFARWISEEYLAPPAATLRSMLPPGMLEKLELVAERAPAVPVAEEATGAVLGGAPVDREEEALLERLDGGPRPARDLEGADGRAATLRRLRSMAARGLVRMEWTLTATVGPRYERWLKLSAEGRAAVGEGSGAAPGASSVSGTDAPTVAAAPDPAPASAPRRPRLGPRQRAMLDELVAAADAGLSAAEAAGRHGSGTATGLIRRGLVEAEICERPRNPIARRKAGRRGSRPPGSELTAPQAEALALILAAVTARDATPLLLEGITGSGKTAVYAEAIAEAISTGRAALVLVPEIALAMPLVDRLRMDLEAEIAIMHSGLGAGERADEWRRVRAGEVDVVVGTRAALTAPLADIGLIVVDEEHDAGYKSDRTPRLQARDAALALGLLAGAAVVLGSATPSVESVGRVRQGRYNHAVLPDRPTGAPPHVEVVDLRAELADGNRGLLSGALSAGLESLPPDERAILMINRRGTASVVMCRDCGYVQVCSECERTLVYHQAGVTLRCHHCGTATPLASRCPTCRSPRIRYLGGGTQRVEEEVKGRFPHLRVGRLDRDVAERKGAVEQVLDAFGEGRLDVLVGTSLVAKGLDIPEVTLVGIISADIALNLPDERAAERTYQLLAQAIGRAGRGEMPGLAIIQTYQPDHPAIQAVASGRPASFYDAELAVRERFGSPPFGRLVKLTVGLPDQLAAEKEAGLMADRLRLAAERATHATAEILGPAPAYIARRAGRWRWNVVLRGERPLELLDPPPGAPWSIDVDPDSLL